MSRTVVFVMLGTVFTLPAIGSAQQSQPTASTDVHEHVAVTAPFFTPREKRRAGLGYRR